MYTKEVRFLAAGGETTAVMLPAPMQGTLKSVSLEQVTGDPVNASFRILNRRGAIPGQFDLNVIGGVIVDITDNGSSECRVKMAAAHGLKPGDTLEVKGTTVAAYHHLPMRVLHTVVAVVDPVTVDTDITYTSDATGGIWQTQPEVNPTMDPDRHVIYDDTDVVAGYSHDSDDDSLTYSNRDAQTLVARRRTTALWLQITPEGTGDKIYEIAYSIDKSGSD